MALNAFLQFGNVEGESIAKGKEKWIEIQGWDIPAGTASPTA